jgi:endonuclease YncB( thermonuclease family)
VPLFLINGTYRVTGGVPDGDSVRFYPDDQQAFSTLGLAVRVNARGGARLRLTGIDALEIAYTPRDCATPWHQPLELAHAGAAALAAALGFDKVERDESGRVVTSLPRAAPGHVLTRGADAHGRVVGFAFAGRRRGKITDLAPVRLDVAGVRDSVNWMLLRQGLAYPVAFSRMYPDLRAELAAAASHARTQQRGVWPRDVTQAGFRLADREQLQDEIVVLPRLFRRLVDYLELEEPGGLDLSGFSAYLTARADLLMIVPEGHVTGLNTVVEIHQQQVRLMITPERLVFFERFFLAR